MAKAEKKGGSKKAASDRRSRLVLLDSHAIIHRAYHALPDFSSSKGEPTGALYGLITMLLKSVTDLKPDYIVAARDLPGKTHRHDAYEAYKATRVQAEDELVAQLKRAPDVFKAFGIPVYSAPGFEADDVIGTIVRELRTRKDIETIIASGDLDTLQLVQGERVQVFTLRKGMNDTVIYDEEGVKERYGFGPEHVVDYKALRGDPSDNIPGIKGIGEKTATELIKEFGSVEDMYRTLEKDEAAFAKRVKPRIAELVKHGKKEALFSKSLATIRADAPISFETPNETWTLAAHIPTILSLCDELEFKSLKERVRSLAGLEPSVDTAVELKKEPIDPVALRETSVALWLLHSDTSNPSLEDILRFAKTGDFETARKHIFSELKKTGRLEEVYEKIEKPLIAIVQRMNETGVYLDVPHLKELGSEYRRELGKIAARIYAHAGREFNINSPKQIGVVLYDELNITPARQKMTAGGARTTREEELTKLKDAHPIILDVLAYRELQKLLSTYVEKMPALVGQDGRLHAEFLQAGTTTGRMSSQHPNLQNIPIKTSYGRRIREAFSSARGYRLLALDYSQIELRIAAGLSGDKKLIQIFKSGGDVHRAVASEVFGVLPEKVDYEMRRRAKVINFGILYGMGVNALRANLSEGGGTITRDEAARFLEAYFKNFAGLARYIEETKASAARLGYTETLFGRRRYFGGFSSSLPNIRAQAERMAMNAPMQGTQSDIIKLAMTEADRIIGEKGWRDPSTYSTDSTGSPKSSSGQASVRLVLQVHDELVYEVEEDVLGRAAPLIRQAMEAVVPISKLSDVPILVEASVGKNWGDMEKFQES